MEKNQIIASMKEVRNEYYNTICNFIAESMTSEWKVTTFSNSRMSIGFVTGQWANGTDRYTEIEVSFGYDWKYKFDRNEAVKNFLFEINPFTAGSFNPLESGRLQTYFAGIGKFCNDKEFAQNLMNLLKEFTEKFEVYNEQLKQIEREEDRIRRAEAEAEKEAKEVADYNEKVESLRNLKSTDDLFVVIKKGDGGKFIYRKQEIQLATSPITWQEANRTVYNINRGYVPCGIKYQVVEASKIKF